MWQKHTTKPCLHTANPLPCVALDIGHLTSIFPAKAFPCALCRAHGKAFAMCNINSRQNKVTRRRNDGDGQFAMCPMSNTRQTCHQWTTRLVAFAVYPASSLQSVLSSPSAGSRQTLFLSCACYLPSGSLETHGKRGVCRVPNRMHSANATAHGNFNFPDDKHTVNIIARWLVASPANLVEQHPCFVQQCLSC